MKITLAIAALLGLATAEQIYDVEMFEDELSELKGKTDPKIAKLAAK